MTANWFEAKVKYMKVNEDGREKKVNEAYGSREQDYA